MHIKHYIMLTLTTYLHTCVLFKQYLHHTPPPLPPRAGGSGGLCGQRILLPGSTIPIVPSWSSSHCCFYGWTWAILHNTAPSDSQWYCSVSYQCKHKFYKNIPHCWNNEHRGWTRAVIINWRPVVWNRPVEPSSTAHSWIQWTTANTVYVEAAPSLRQYKIRWRPSRSLFLVQTVSESWRWCCYAEIQKCISKEG